MTWYQMVLMSVSSYISQFFWWVFTMIFSIAYRDSSSIILLDPTIWAQSLNWNPKHLHSLLWKAQTLLIQSYSQGRKKKSISIFYIINILALDPGFRISSAWVYGLWNHTLTASHKKTYFFSLVQFHNEGLKYYNFL